MCQGIEPMTLTLEVEYFTIAPLTSIASKFVDEVIFSKSKFVDLDKAHNFAFVNLAETTKNRKII